MFFDWKNQIEKVQLMRDINTTLYYIKEHAYLAKTIKVIAILPLEPR